MKKRIKKWQLLTIVLGLTSSIYSQSPYVDWRSITWEGHQPHSETSVYIGGGSPPSATDPILQDDSGDDWTYDITNYYNQGVHDGYMTCGYTRFVNYASHTDQMPLGSNGGRYNMALTSPVDHCNIRVPGGENLSKLVGTIGKYDLDGNMIWCQERAFGEYFAITRDEDGNYIAVGNAADFVDPHGESILYKSPGNPNVGTDLSTLSATDFDKTLFKNKIIVTKLNEQGDHIWSFLYGMEDIYSGAFSSNNTALGLGFVGFGVDIVTLPSGEYVIYGTSFDYGTNSGTTHLYKLDPDGNITGRTTYGGVGESMIGRSMEIDGSGQGMVCTGAWGVPGATDAFIFKINDDLSLDPDWGAWGDPNQPILIDNFIAPGENSVAQGLIINELEGSTGTVTVAVIHGTDGAIWSGESNFGEIHLYKFKYLDGGQISNPAIFNSADGSALVTDQGSAYDFKVGLCRTDDDHDGVASLTDGFALVTSVIGQPNPYNCSIAQPYIDFFNNVGTGSNCDCNSQNYDVWETDAYVAKFKYDGLQQWDISFDSDNNGPINFPGDYKEQECLYKITQADDGGLVIVGNTSHNMDDYYMARVAYQGMAPLLSSEELGSSSLQNSLSNYPDPFSNQTTIKYNWPENSTDNGFIVIYGIDGVEIRRFNVSSSSNTIKLELNDLDAGMYIYSLLVDNQIINTDNMIITK